MKIRFCIVSLLLVSLLTTNAMADQIHVNDLIESARELDNQKVQISGDAIGDVMLRGSMGWVNILDQGTAVGIWASSDQLEKITTLGSYAQGGDTVTVIGTFHRACPEHGGEFDIHGEQIIIDRSGAVNAYAIEKGKAAMAAVLLPVTLVLVWSLQRGKRT